MIHIGNANVYCAFGLPHYGYPTQPIAASERSRYASETINNRKPIMPKPPTRSANLAAQLKAEQEKIQAAQQRIQTLHSREGERLVKLAAKCGLLDVEVSDTDIERAFRDLATKKRSAQPAQNA